MELKEIMEELKSLGTERTKKIYMSNGAKEPVFGVTISAMKPIFKKIKYNQHLAEQLYATGNYDAMYLAGTLPLSIQKNIHVAFLIKGGE
jgi:hypothetical protein